MKKMLMALAASMVGLAVSADDALASRIQAKVREQTAFGTALRAKALSCKVDGTRVVTGTWKEKWPNAAGEIETRDVTGEIWRAAIQATLDTCGAVYVPGRREPYYLDGPIALKSGQAFVAAPDAEFRLMPNKNTCMLRNANVVGTDQKTFEVPACAYDGRIYIEGGVWTTLKVARREPNGNHTGHIGAKKRVHGCHGVFVLNHVDGVVVKDVTVKQCNAHAIQLSDVRHFQVEGITFVKQGRDGVHLHGECYWGVVRDVTGSTHDDMIAINAWDWGHTSPALGPIEHVLVENVRRVLEGSPDYERFGEGTYNIRLLPGNKKRADGTTKPCPVNQCVLRDLRNLSTIKIYDQPNLERGRNNDFSDPIGSIGNVFISNVEYDRPSNIEVDVNVDGLHISDVRFNFEKPEKFNYVIMGPKSGMWTPGKDPGRWVEIFSPDLDITVRNFSFTDVSVRRNGKMEKCADPIGDFVYARDMKPNPDYPKTLPKGGTGKLNWIR